MISAKLAALGLKIKVFAIKVYNILPTKLYYVTQIIS